jgi:elongation factor Tu
VGIPRVVVALTKCDLVEDPELLDLVTMEIREQLRKREYGGDAAPVVPVSGLPPERGGERALAGLAGLLDAVDRWIP